VGSNACIWEERIAWQNPTTPMLHVTMLVGMRREVVENSKVSLLENENI